MGLTRRWGELKNSFFSFLVFSVVSLFLITPTFQRLLTLKRSRDQSYLIRRIWSEVWVLSCSRQREFSLMWNDSWCRYLLELGVSSSHFEPRVFSLSSAGRSEPSKMTSPSPPPRPEGTILALLLRRREESASSSLLPLPCFFTSRKRLQSWSGGRGLDFEDDVQNGTWRQMHRKGREENPSPYYPI